MVSGTSTWRVTDGLADGRLNMAFEAVDRHVAQGRGATVAMRFLSEDLPDRSLTYLDMSVQSSMFASALRTMGATDDDLVYVLGGRRPESYIAMLGALKVGCAVAPIFTAFGPEPVRQRLWAGRGRILVATAAAYLAKVRPIRDTLPDLRHIVLIGPKSEGIDDPGVSTWDVLMSEASPDFPAAQRAPRDPAFVHFTSGTTGTPKGAVLPQQAVIDHEATARSVLGLRDGDVYWCTADPGWVTGTAYGLIAPLTCGVTCIVDESEFDAGRWAWILEEHRVSVWYTAPTALRMLMKAGPELWQHRDLSALRHVASVGEPLNPEVISWGRANLDRLIHDTWWQTETGSIMIANGPDTAVRPGSMGQPVAGIDIALVEHDQQGERVLLADGSPSFVHEPGAQGEIAIRAPWPSMMLGYLNAPDRYASCFAGGWYLSGDLARRDADGYVWFVGRGDDVIKSAGHLIGPFEVESVLMEHPAVVEAGVVGVPDPLVGESVRAFVTLGVGFEASDELRRDISAFARSRLGSAVAPRQVEVEPHLPHTQSGKIMRRLLRARALGLPEGDTSTLGATA